jgi:hypothetical protein
MANKVLLNRRVVLQVTGQIIMDPFRESNSKLSSKLIEMLIKYSRYLRNEMLYLTKLAGEN